MTVLNKIHAVASAAVLLFSLPASAGLVGSSISQCANTAYSGTVTTDISQCLGASVQPSPTTAIVGAGVEFSTGTDRSWDFGDNTLTVTYLNVTSASPDLVIFDLAFDITGFALLGGNPLDITWATDGNRLGILAGSPLVNGAVTFSVLTGSVPEPTTAALVAVALLAAGACTRRRRT